MHLPLRRALVVGPSMAPALRHGDVVVVRLRPRPPARGRVVLVQLPDGTVAVKRVMDVGSDGGVWVEGDNPFGSADSRSWGPLPASAVRGVVLFRLWPRPGSVPAWAGHNGPGGQ